MEIAQVAMHPSGSEFLVPFCPSLYPADGGMELSVGRVTNTKVTILKATTQPFLKLRAVGHVGDERLLALGHVYDLRSRGRRVEIELIPFGPSELGGAEGLKTNFVFRLALALAFICPPYGVAAQETPLLATEIATLLQRCQKCHRPGQIGPMPLRTYAEIKPWLPLIRTAVSTRRMPPWFADRAYGDFLDNPSFTDQEIERIIAWIDAGAPRGDRGTEPAPLEFSDSWGIGEPDLVLPMPTPISIDANNEDRFVRVKIKTELTEDRWIKAVEVRPCDRSLVHHAIVYVLQRGERDRIWSRMLRRPGYLLSEYSAGNQGDIYPSGVGRLMQAGAKLLLDIHYLNRGDAVRSDQTQPSWQSGARVRLMKWLLAGSI